jgi:hypothetical protein
MEKCVTLFNHQFIPWRIRSICEASLPNLAAVFEVLKRLAIVAEGSVGSSPVLISSCIFRIDIDKLVVIHNNLPCSTCR